MNTVANHLKASARGRSLVHLTDLLRELVARELKLRYKRSALGLAWSLLVPLAQMGVLYVVFHHLLPLNIPTFATFLLTGILPWTWFQTSLLAACGAIMDNREIIRQVGFPVGVLPAITVISQLVHFLLALPVLLIFLLMDGYRLGPSIAALPVVILVQLALTLSLAYIVATLQVTFHDTQHLTGIFLFLLFYLTPVFYNDSDIPRAFRPFYELNPMVHLLGAYRAILIKGQLPAAGPMLTLSVAATGVFALGYFIFNRAHDRFVEEL